MLCARCGEPMGVCLPESVFRGILCMCRALLNNPMKEGQDGIVTIQDVREPVFRALLYFVYADALPEVPPEQSARGSRSFARHTSTMCCMLCFCYEEAPAGVGSV